MFDDKFFYFGYLFVDGGIFFLENYFCREYNFGVVFYMEVVWSVYVCVSGFYYKYK